jgi:hypothetical protein
VDDDNAADDDEADNEVETADKNDAMMMKLMMKSKLPIKMKLMMKSKMKMKKMKLKKMKMNLCRRSGRHPRSDYTHTSRDGTWNY